MESIINPTYTHIFLIHETYMKFPQNIIRMVASEDDINEKEHLFVFPYQDEYEQMNQIIKNEGMYDIRIEYCGTGKLTDLRIINYYAKKSTWVILHGIKPKQVFFIHPWNLKKIVWRTWGSDFEFKPTLFLCRRGIVYIMLKELWKLVLKHIYMIGIANSADLVNIQDNLGNDVSTMQIPYPKKSLQISEIISKEQTYYGNTVNVLVGHSGYITDRHLEILGYLSKFRDKQINIYLPLCYGDHDYISHVEHVAIEKWNTKVKIIKQMMTWENYVLLLNSMHVGVFAGVNSYALGNITLMITLRKKIYLDPNGVLGRAFSTDGMPFGSIYEIDKTNFEEFIKPVEYGEAINNWRCLSYEEKVKQWKSLLCALNLGEKKKRVGKGKCKDVK